MFREFDAFEKGRRLRRRKTWTQWFVFLIANLLLLPVLIVTHASVAGDGIRSMLPVFQRKIWSLPIPTASFARHYDGFDKLDLAFLAAISLFSIAALTWKHLFLTLQEPTADGVSVRSSASGLIRMAIVLCVLGADAGLFWAGLASQSACGWSDPPTFVAPLATALFTSLTAACALWHVDFHTSRYV